MSRDFFKDLDIAIRNLERYENVKVIFKENDKYYGTDSTDDYIEFLGLLSYYLSLPGRISDILLKSYSTAYAIYQLLEREEGNGEG